MKNLLSTILLALLTLGPALAQQARPVPAFHAIRLGGGLELTLTAGATQRVEVSTEPAELAQYLTTTVEDGTLVLRFEHPGGNVRSQHLRVAVTASQLTAVQAGGGSVVKATGAFAAPTFALEAASGSVVHAALTVRELTVSAHGGSVLTLKGQADKLTLSANGGSIFNGAGLLAAACQAQAGGGSIVHLSARQTLTATAEGGSSIRYQGGAQATTHVSGGSTIKGS